MGGHSLSDVGGGTADQTVGGTACLESKEAVFTTFGQCRKSFRVDYLIVNRASVELIK